MQYKELKELIDHFEQFGQETGSQDIGPFAYWLHHKLNINPSPAQEKSEKQLNAKIAEEMGKLSNFSKHYIKKAVKDTPLAGWNDMVAIIILFYGGSRRKTELIQMAMMELSPGMEVVRRLLRLGYIEEFPDPNDGRAKQVSLTESGREMYQKVEHDIDKVSEIVGGNLTLEEKHLLHTMMEKLTHFHFPIWRDAGQESLDEILHTYISPLHK